MGVSCNDFVIDGHDCHHLITIMIHNAALLPINYYPTDHRNAETGQYYSARLRTADYHAHKDFRPTGRVLHPCTHAHMRMHTHTHTHTHTCTHACTYTTCTCMQHSAHMCACMQCTYACMQCTHIRNRTHVQTCTTWTHTRAHACMPIHSCVDAWMYGGWIYMGGFQGVAYQSTALYPNPISATCHPTPSLPPATQPHLCHCHP